MKRLFVLLLIGFGMAAAISLAVHLDPGYVRISVGHWLIESNLWVMLFLNITFLAISLLLIYLLRRAFSSHSTLKNWFGQSAQVRANRRTQSGLLAYLEGNWAEANKLLSRSAARSDTPIVNYLAAAHAANELGLGKDADQLLKQAYDRDANSDFAIGIAQAQFQLARNQLESCLATLVRLKQQQPQHPLVLKLLGTVYQRLEDWQQLIKLLPALKKLPTSDAKFLSELEAKAWQQSFVVKGEELKRQQRLNDAAEELAELWRQAPESLRFNPLLIQSYSEQLINLHKQKEAEALLRKALGRNWSDNLVRLYGMVEGKDTSEQLIHAESWLKARPNNSELLLCLGRLSLRNELWGKALEYFEASARLKSSREANAELCKLGLRMSEDQSKRSRYIEQLMASLDLPDLPTPH